MLMGEAGLEVERPPGAVVGRRGLGWRGSDVRDLRERKGGSCAGQVMLRVGTSGFEQT